MIRGTIKKPMCDGCDRPVEMIAGWGIWYCSVYPMPWVWLRRGGCPMNQRSLVAVTKRVNPIKASKRKGK